MSHPTRARDIMIIGKKNGAKLIVVDPRFCEIASKADIFLQVRPGADDALALGLLNVIINEELYDKEFVDKWCIGFPELKEHLDMIGGGIADLGEAPLEAWPERAPIAAFGANAFPFGMIDLLDKISSIIYTWFAYY